MKDSLQVLLQNPLLLSAMLSMFAFPMGTCFLLLVIKKFLLNGVWEKGEKYILLYKERTEVEHRIEGQLSLLLQKIDTTLSLEQDISRSFSTVNAKLDSVLAQLASGGF